MLGLIEPDLAPSWQLEVGQDAPWFMDDRTEHDVPVLQDFHRGCQIVTRQVEHMPAIRIVRVKGNLGRRQRKNEPACMGIDEGKLQYIAEVGAVRFRVLTVYNHVSAMDHENLSPCENIILAGDAAMTRLVN